MNLITFLRKMVLNILRYELSTLNILRYELSTLNILRNELSTLNCTLVNTF